MTRIISSLSEISNSYDALFCDLWGCLHNGVEAFPGAVAALQAFREGRQGSPSDQRAASVEVRDGSIDKLGCPRDAYDLVVSSGDAAQDAMFAGAVGKKVWHLGPSKDDGFFTEVPEESRGKPRSAAVDFDDAEGIVCTGPFDEVNEVPKDYRPKFLLAEIPRVPDAIARTPISSRGSGRQAHLLRWRFVWPRSTRKWAARRCISESPIPPIYDLARRKLSRLGGAEGVARRPRHGRRDQYRAWPAPRGGDGMPVHHRRSGA